MVFNTAALLDAAEALRAEGRAGLNFLSVNIGRVTGRYDTEGTQYVTGCIADGPRKGEWVGLVFFKARTSVPLKTGMFLRVGITRRHNGKGLPTYNVGWAELRGFGGVGFRAGVVSVVAKP